MENSEFSGFINFYDVFSFEEDNFSFKNIQSKQAFNRFEGQIDTGKMMDALLKKVQQSNVKILNGIEVNSYSEDGNGIKVDTLNFEFSTKKLLIATNGFASKLLAEPVKPARAQVLITKPIKDLNIKGTFHLDKGYYYFRNIDNRILFGGGRNLDFKTEETYEFGETALVKEELTELLRTTILPDQQVEIDKYWSGIMGVGQHKKPIVKQLEKNN